MTTASTDDDEARFMREILGDLAATDAAERAKRAAEAEAAQRAKQAADAAADEQLTKELASMTDEERERRMLMYLDKVLGPGDEKLMSSLVDIWKGTATIAVLDRDGRPATRLPNYNERMSAMDMLMNRHRGRAVFRPTGALKPKADDEGKWDPDALEVEDLKTIKTLAGKVKKT